MILAIFKDRLVYLSTIFISLFMMNIFIKYLLNFNMDSIFFINFLLLISIFLSTTIELYKKGIFYSNLIKSFKDLEKKSLISEIVEVPNFAEGKILIRCLDSISQSTNREIAQHKQYLDDYREYLDTWVHEIKTSILGCQLAIDNKNYNISKELQRIEYYVEQVLYYSKINTIDQDYIIRKSSLSKLINDSIKKHSKSLINANISVNINLNDIKFIFLDPKWLSFILDQIIINSIKYKSESNCKLSIIAERKEHSIYLILKDNGIGINSQDLGKVFYKGFTGENGRKYANATGMGLYICKKLTDKMGISISVNSTVNLGTTITLIIPKNEMTSF